MNEQTFDVAVIGGGPGGYVAAIRAAQLGMKVVCIDDFIGRSGGPSLGGTCLNVGCIPSKAVLQSSEHFEQANHHFAEHGISMQGVQMDVPQMIARKDGIVDKLTGGIAFLFKKNKVTSIHGRASFAGQHEGLWQLNIQSPQGTGEEAHPQITAKHVIVATGSVPRPLPMAPVDHIKILDNASALNIQSVPKHLGIIGAGVIGLEMGSVWKRLGSDVTILEAAPSFLGAADQQIAKEAQKIFNKQGLVIHTGIQISQIDAAGEGVRVDYTLGDASHQLEVDQLIVAVGRIPNTQGLGVAEVGLALDERGFVVVDDHCQTNLPNVWAIGDVVRGPMLAHKASEEGVAVAERLAGQKPHLDFNTIPWVIYTSPEIAWVGQTEEQLKSSGIAYKKGVFGFGANGRALGLGLAQGMVKMLACAETDRILGVHMIGPMVSELISEAVVAMEFKASSEDLARIIHAHPTLSEVVHEAALACDGRALHG
jgi:dihydrolipoamide dehydrogenase